MDSSFIMGNATATWHGVIDPSMYAYLIYRKAIEWAFESFSLPNR